MKIAVYIVISMFVGGVSCTNPPVAAPQPPVIPPPVVTQPVPVKPKVTQTPKKRVVKSVTPEPEIVLPLRPAQVGGR